MGSSFLSSPSRLSLSRIHSLPAAAPIPFHQGLDPSSSLVAQLVNNLPVLKEIPVQFLGREEPLEKGWATNSSILGLLWVVQMVKNLSANAGDLGSIPGLGRSPGEGDGCPLQYSGLENSMDRIVHGVTKSQTRLSDFHFSCLCPNLLLLSGHQSYFIRAHPHDLISPELPLQRPCFQNTVTF